MKLLPRAFVILMLLPALLLACQTNPEVNETIVPTVTGLPEAPEQLEEPAVEGYPAPAQEGEGYPAPGAAEPTPLPEGYPEPQAEPTTNPYP